MERRKKIVIPILAGAFAVSLCLGLVLGFAPRRMRAGDVYTTAAEDFTFAPVPHAASLAAQFETTDGGNFTTDDKTAFCITGLDDTFIQEAKDGTIVLKIPETIGENKVAYVKEGAFESVDNIVDVQTPLSVFWQVTSDYFTLDNLSDYATGDGETATFTGMVEKDMKMLILPSNVWIDNDKDGKMESGEPTYRYTEFLFSSNKTRDKKYENLVVTADVINIFNPEDGKIQGGLLAKCGALERVSFATGRERVLPIYSLTFESCTQLKEINLSAGVLLADGARAFQGCTAIESITIAEEHNAGVPSFYQVGTDGALYTADYRFDYYNTNGVKDYYSWWTDPETGVVKVLDCSASSKIEGAKEGRTVSYPDKSPTVTEYYPNSAADKVGIPVPKGSYVVDFGTKDETGDFATGSENGNYPEGADFKTIKIEISADSKVFGETDLPGYNDKDPSTWPNYSSEDSKVTVSGTKGTTADTTLCTMTNSNGSKTYSGAPQIKPGRPVKIEVGFDFTLTAYFVKSGSGTKKTGLYTGWESDKNIGTIVTVGGKEIEITDAPVAKEASADDFQGPESGKMTAEGLKKGTYYIVTSEEDSIGVNRLLAVVITPNPVTSVSLASDGKGETPLRNGAVVLSEGESVELFADIRFFDGFDANDIGAVQWSVLMPDGGENEIIELDASNDYNRVTVKPKGSYTPGQAIVRATVGGKSAYAYVNLRGTEAATSMPAKTTDQKIGYQSLVFMPPQYKDGDTAVSYFDFDYTETVEIGDNAFNGTQITVIDIPDRIAKIGMNAFRFSDRLQTVYLPDNATFGSDVFGQESDADGTEVYTAGKKNFVLIAPSRDSYEHYLKDERFDRVGDDDLTKDGSSHIYSDFLTYEITVHFQKVAEGNITAEEERTYLYGKDKTFVKNTTDATKAWETDFDNSTVLLFGHRTTKSGNTTIQTANTLPKDWSIAPNGWYIDGSASEVVPAGEWYYGSDSVIGNADDLASFLSGEKLADLRIGEINFTQTVRKKYKELYENADRSKITNFGDLQDPTDWAETKTIYTMPREITLKSAAADATKVARFDVPDFQTVGDVQVRGEMPTITVLFDFTGFPASRILNGIDSGRMNVEYKDEGDTEGNKGLRNGIPYDAGTYTVTLSLNTAANSEYTYEWSGSYNGLRVAEGDQTQKVFRLIIKPRPVYVSDSTVHYSGNGVVVYEDNPYYTAKYNSQGGALEDGLPCDQGTYDVTLQLYDPKYPDGNTPNLYWYGYEDEDEAGGDRTVELYIDETPKLEAPTAVHTEFEYTGRVITMEEIFGGTLQHFSMKIENAAEIKDAKDYTLSVTPAEGYEWKEGGTAAKQYTIKVSKKSVKVPMDSFISDATKPPFEFYVSPTAEYFVEKYTKVGGEGPGDVEIVTETGKYDVTLALYDTENYKWETDTSEEAQRTVTVNLYVGTPDEGLTKPALIKDSVVYALGMSLVPADLLNTDFIGEFMDLETKKDGTVVTQITGAGEYTLTVTLKGAVEAIGWAGDGGKELKFTFTVEKKEVAKPEGKEIVIAAEEKEYTFPFGSDKPADFALYSVTQYKAGDQVVDSVTKAGSYTVRFTLKDEANYTWKEGTSEPLEVTFTFLEKIAAPSVTAAEHKVGDAENPVHMADVLGYGGVTTHNAIKVFDEITISATKDGDSQKDFDPESTELTIGTWTFTFTLPNGYVQWESALGDLTVEMYDIIAEQPSLKSELDNLYEKKGGYTDSELIDNATGDHFETKHEDAPSADGVTRTFTFTPAEHYRWDAADKSARTLSVEIRNRTEVAVPTLNTSAASFYNGSLYERDEDYQLSDLLTSTEGYTSETETISGTAAATEVEFELDGTHKWATGGDITDDNKFDPYTLHVAVIARTEVAQPSAKRVFARDLPTDEENYAYTDVLNGYDANAYTTSVREGKELKEADTYTLVLTPKPDHKWLGSDHPFDPLEISLTIEAWKELDVPTLATGTHYPEQDGGIDPYTIFGLAEDVNKEGYIIRDGANDPAGNLVDVRQYNLTVVPDTANGYRWKDKSSTEQQYTVYVTATVVRPTARAGTVYDSFTPYSLADLLADFRAEAYQVSIQKDGERVGSIGASGEYTVTFTLTNDLYSWKDRAEERTATVQLTVTERTALPKPALKAGTFYEKDGEESYTLADLVTYAAEGTTVSGWENTGKAGRTSVRFTLGEAYKWNDGTDGVVELSVVVTAYRLVNKPALKAGTFYEKDGEESYTLSDLVDYVTTGYTVSGWTDTGEDGVYSVTFSLSEGYRWNGKTKEDVVLAVLITPYRLVAKPTLKEGTFYGREEAYTLADLVAYETEGYTVSGWTDTGKEGEYVVKFALAEGYRWEGGGSDEVTLSVVLTPPVLPEKDKGGTDLAVVIALLSVQTVLLCAILAVGIRKKKGPEEEDGDEFTDGEEQ